MSSRCNEGTSETSRKAELDGYEFYKEKEPLEQREKRIPLKSS